MPHTRTIGAIVLLAVASLARGGDWPQFRGPGGLGVAADATPPTEWDGAAKKNIVWKADLPLPGQSSPIACGGHVYMTGADESRRQLWCFDAKDGKLLWSKPVVVKESLTQKPPEIAEDTTFAAPTPVCDGKNVYALFTNGDLACFGSEGQAVWARSFGPLDNTYGHASSPVPVPGGNLIVLQFDQGNEAKENKSLLVAVDKTSGKTVWQTKRPVHSSWTTPLVIEVGKGKQVVTCADPWVISYNAEDGKELWRASLLGGDVAPSAVFGGGLVIVAAAQGRLAAIKPDGSGDVSKTHVSWSADENLPEIPSPVTNGKQVFLAADDGMTTCYDVGDGKKLWEHDFMCEFRSSPSIAGDRVYVCDRKGVMHIFKAGAEFEEVGTGNLGEPSETTPAFSGNRIYQRAKTHLYCIGTP